MKEIFIDNTQKKLTRFQYLLLYFTIYSLVGWLLETLFAFYIEQQFVNRGFLFGPFCPLYGFSGILLITFLDKYKKNKKRLFLYAMIIFTVFEYISGFALDALFKLKWWDYSNDFMNLNSRVSVFYSLAWGIISVVFLCFIHSLIEKRVNTILKKVPYIIQNIGLKLIFIIFVLDAFLSSIIYLGIGP